MMTDAKVRELHVIITNKGCIKGCELQCRPIIGISRKSGNGEDVRAVLSPYFKGFPCLKQFIQ
jgi:hypothetical protein